MLLSSNLNTSDTGKMNAPPLRSPRFQSPPLQQHPNAKGKLVVLLEFSVQTSYLQSNTVRHLCIAIL